MSGSPFFAAVDPDVDRDLKQRLVDADHVKAVCRPGIGAGTCRYLVAGHRGLECAKHTTLRAQIDARVDAGTFVAQGDNCLGKGRLQ